MNSDKRQVANIDFPLSKVGRDYLGISENQDHEDGGNIEVKGQFGDA